MKVRMFLKKFLHASSTIDRVFIAQGGTTTPLSGFVVADPTTTNPSSERMLNANIVSFRIVCEDLTIYVK